MKNQTQINKMYGLNGCGLNCGLAPLACATTTFALPTCTYATAVLPACGARYLW